MGVNTWRSLSRGILVFTNVLFLLLGTVLITLGGYMMSLPDLNEFSDGGIAGAIITCGAMILMIALLGCCGAQWDSKVFLFPYATLVLVSVIAQFALAGFMYHVHGVLVNAAEHNFDLSVLSASDQKVLRWIHHRFEAAYDECGLAIDVDLSLRSSALTATCTNPRFDWFARFIEKNCRIGASDLKFGSDFLKCAGATFRLSDPITEHGMLCACESRMITWVNDQSLLIAVFVFTIVFFEIVLVALSCYVMCTRRKSGFGGYQNIRMPLKAQQPYNPHPRNYFPSPAGNNGQGDYRQPLQPLLQQPSYNSMATSPSTFQYGAVAPPGQQQQQQQRDNGQKSYYT